jgi:hypothetical protein
VHLGEKKGAQTHVNEQDDNLLGITIINLKMDVGGLVMSLYAYEARIQRFRALLYRIAFRMSGFVSTEKRPKKAYQPYARNVYFDEMLQVYNFVFQYFSIPAHYI